MKKIPKEAKGDEEQWQNNCKIKKQKCEEAQIRCS